MKIKTNAIFSDLSTDELLRFAGKIDNGYYAAEDSFLCTRTFGKYLIHTDRCDDLSFIRVYCEVGKPGIDKIERLGEDTDGWKEVHPDTYKTCEDYLNQIANNQK